jgi:hypothetical protein
VARGAARSTGPARRFRWRRAGVACGRREPAEGGLEWNERVETAGAFF